MEEVFLATQRTISMSVSNTKTSHTTKAYDRRRPKIGRLFKFVGSLLRYEAVCQKYEIIAPKAVHEMP